MGLVTVGQITIADNNDGISVLLGNENQSFPATYAGVATAGSISTTVVAYRGSTLAATTLGAATGLPTGMTATPVGSGTTSASYTITVTTALAGDSGIVTLPITVDGKVVNKFFSWNKSKAGADSTVAGPQGPSVNVTPNRVQTFTATDGNLDASQADIIFTAAVSGVTSPTYAWTFTGLQTNPTASTTATQTITAAQFGTSNGATVKCTVSGAFNDLVTVVRLEKSSADAGATVGATTAEAAVLATTSANATAANNAVIDMALDSKLTPVEKQLVRKEWDAIYSEKAVLDAQATAMGITTEKTTYGTAYTALGTYLNGGAAYTPSATPPSWITDANLSVTTTIVGATFRSTFKSYYDARVALISKMSAVAATTAAWTSVASRPTSLAALNTDDGTKLSGIATGATKAGSIYPDFPQWVYGGTCSVVTISGGPVGSTVLRMPVGSGYPLVQNYYPIDRLKTTFRVRFWAMATGFTDNNGLLYFDLQQFVDFSGTTGPINGGRSPYKPSGVNKDLNGGNGVWKFWDFEWGPADWQAGVVCIKPDCLGNYNGTSGYWDVQGLEILDTTGISNSDLTPSIVAAATTANWTSVASRPTSVATLNATDGTNLANGATAFTGTANLRTLSAPTNNGAITSAVGTATADGNVLVAITYTYTQSTVKADSVLIYAKSGGGTITTADQCWVTNAVSGVFSIICTPGVAYSFAIQAIRTADGGVQATAVSAVTNMTAVTGNYTGNVSGVAALTVKDNAANALANAATANNNIGYMTSDNYISQAEKRAIFIEWETIYDEKTGIDTQAAGMGITTERTAYTTAFTTLQTYLNASPILIQNPPTDGNAWVAITTALAITGSTFRANFALYYSARQTLLNKIVEIAASVDSTFVATGVGTTTIVTATGTLTKTAGVASWDTGFYSKESYINGAIASAKVVNTTSTVMFGLNTDPTTDSSFTSIDYAMYQSGTSLQVYHSGVSQGSIGTAAIGDILSVVYDGFNVKYIQNGNVLKTTAVAAGLRLYFDSSFNAVGASLTNCFLQPYSSSVLVSANMKVDTTNGGVDLLNNGWIKTAGKLTDGTGTGLLYGKNNLGKTIFNVGTGGKGSVTPHIHWDETDGSFEVTGKLIAGTGSVIKGAHIEALSVTNAQIADATIESAKVVNLTTDKIVAGSLLLGTGHIGNLDAGVITTGVLRAGTVDVSSMSGISMTYATAGTYQVVVPAGMTSCKVTMWGGGGGGGYPTCGSRNTGGGGGGLTVATFTNAVPGSTLTLVVGAAGANNANGGNSTLTGTNISATAGGGKAGIGYGPMTNYAGWIAGGLGGTGTYPGQTGPSNYWYYDYTPEWFDGKATYPEAETYYWAYNTAGGTGGNSGSGLMYGHGGGINNGGVQSGWACVELFSPLGVVTRTEWNTMKAYMATKSLIW